MYNSNRLAVTAGCMDYVACLDLIAKNNRTCVQGDTTCSSCYIGSLSNTKDIGGMSKRIYNNPYLMNVKWRFLIVDVNDDNKEPNHEIGVFYTQYYGSFLTCITMIWHVYYIMLLSLFMHTRRNFLKSVFIKVHHSPICCYMVAMLHIKPFRNNIVISGDSNYLSLFFNLTKNSMRFIFIKTCVRYKFRAK